MFVKLLHQQQKSSVQIMTVLNFTSCTCQLDYLLHHFTKRGINPIKLIEPFYCTKPGKSVVMHLCAMGIHFLRFFCLEFGNIPTVWIFFFFILIQIQRYRQVTFKRKQSDHLVNLFNSKMSTIFNTTTSNKNRFSLYEKLFLFFVFVFGYRSRLYFFFTVLNL